MADTVAVLFRTQAFRTAAAEQQEVLREFYALADGLLRGTEAPLESTGATQFRPEHHFFSSLFLAAYGALGIPPTRRLLYGFINHCLRALVTGCDNLLDEEYKEVIPFRLEARGSRFRSVLSLLTADRVLFARLRAAERNGELTSRQAEALMATSLTALIPSGVEEASEEGGVERLLSPEAVLVRIHRVKTGHLFRAPLAAPLALGEITAEDDTVFGEALSDFGMGCQLLDDLVDLERDVRERRHNYAVSLIARAEPETVANWSNDDGRRELSRHDFAAIQQTVVHKALEHFDRSISVLGPGFALNSEERRAVVASVFGLLHVPDLLPAFSRSGDAAHSAIG